MILIFSEESDRTTDEVVQWLIFNGVLFLRINKEDEVKIVEISLDEDKIEIEIRGEVHNLCQYNQLWYRRGHFNPSCIRKALIGLENQPEMREQIGLFLSNEWNILQQYLFSWLEHKGKSLGSFSKSQINKLIVLSFAKKCGLLIPRTLISSKGNIILAEATKHPLITKPISEAETFQDTDGTIYKLLTSPVLCSNVSKEVEFFPSLIQHDQKKWIELRIFFINEDYYPMAIFSQNNTKTSTDFRNYDKERPNRMVPFLLPTHIKNKLNKLMKELGLDTGSIDMIVTEKREFIFLEVNPIGNIEMVSKNCNYPIERDIAKHISYDN